MKLYEKLSQSWSDSGLLGPDGKLKPTFIEEVGSASAENTRTAALKRWGGRNRKALLAWLQSIGCINDASYEDLSLAREYQIGGGARIDLAVFSRGSPIVLIEAKWLSLPTIKQIQLYIDRARDLNVTDRPCIVLLSPWNAGLEAEFHDKVRYASWTSLIDYMLDDEPETIEGDLKRTLQRLKQLEDHIGSAVKDDGFELSKFKELLEWLHTVSGESSTKMQPECKQIAALLIITALAETIACGPSTKGRSSLSVGSIKKDVSCDIYPMHIYNGHIYLPDSTEDNVLAALRVQMNVGNPSNPLLQIGSARLPYLEGEKRKAFIRTNEEANQGMLNLAITVRKALHSEIKRMGLKPCGNSETTDWWSVSYRSEANTVAEFKSEAGKLLSIVKNAIECL